MPLVAINQDSCLAMSAFASSVDTVQGIPLRQYFDSDAVHTTFNDLRIANVVYPLRRASKASFIPGAGEFLVEGFSPTFVGQGATLDEARQNWLETVHATFQDLLRQRPFEMTAADSLRWNVLSSWIDVAVYRNSTPVRVRQFGKVSKARPFPQEIKWENGEVEAVRLDQVDSADFVTFKPGQPLEAIVARDPLTFCLKRIVYIQRRGAPTRLPAREEAALLESMGSSQRLPAANWE